MMKGYKRSQENKLYGSFIYCVNDSTNSEDSRRRIYDQFTKIVRIPSERFHSFDDIRGRSEVFFNEPYVHYLHAFGVDSSSITKMGISRFDCARDGFLAKTEW